MVKVRAWNEIPSNNYALTLNERKNSQQCSGPHTFCETNELKIHGHVFYLNEK